MIIWVASYPRSGNTFCRILLNRIYGVQTYSVYNDRIFEESSELAEVVGHSHNDRTIQELASTPGLYFVKTHELPDDDGYAVIYLVRDGRDALVSYAHFIRDFEQIDAIENFSFDDTLRDLVVHRWSFGGWGPHALAWARPRRRLAIVRFEDLIRDPCGEVVRALAIVRPDMEPGFPYDIPTFSELHSVMPQFFREGKVGGWRTEMSEHLHDLFWAHYGGAMTALGYGITDTHEKPLAPMML